MNKPIKIVIADDHEVVLDGLLAILNPVRNPAATEPALLPNGANYEKHPFQIVGIAKSGEDLLEKISAVRLADVLILDYVMGRMNGLEAAAQVKAQLPHLRVVLFSMHESDALIKEAFACNIDGYVTKGEGRQRLLDAIRRVYKGEKVYPQLKNPNGSHQLPAPARSGAAELPLSKREREIVCEIVNGASSQDIAQKLNIAFNTVEVHRSNIYRKLDIKKVADLVKIALENNICTR